MSSGKGGRYITVQDLQLVQYLIERCLMLYMSKREVVYTLSHRAKIEPGFTVQVWKKMEAENQEFFREYNIRLILKDQIVRFNQLLKRQAELEDSRSQNGDSFTPLPSGSQTHSMDRNSVHRDLQPHVLRVKPESMYRAEAIPNHYTNGTYSQYHREIATSMPDHAQRMHYPAQMASLQNPNAGIMQGFNERTIKTEHVYAGHSREVFHADNNIFEAPNVVREVLISPFNGGESSSQSFGESVLETEMNSFGMTQNFGLSDQTAAFSRSTDVLDSYSGSPFMEMNANIWNPRQG